MSSLGHLLEEGRVELWLIHFHLIIFHKVLNFDLSPNMGWLIPVKGQKKHIIHLNIPQIVYDSDVRYIPKLTVMIYC